MAERRPLTIAGHTPAAPVVLAPMAGVTNRAFRSICRSFAPGLVYVNEMVMATAVLHRNPKTETMMAFGADEQPRSLQVYGSDPADLARAVSQLCDEDRVDHIDLNFGCPAAKVTRRGGGAAVPARPALLRAIVRGAVSAAAPYGVPVTAKFRMGIDDDWRTDVRTGLICADEGAHWVALHARTVAQHYAGDARWAAIAELRTALDDAGHDIPVLGNGDIWEATDAVAMMDATGCDGVVIGRGCLGRPWLFADLVTVLSGGDPPPSRTLGEVAATMSAHARALVEHFDGAAVRSTGEDLAMRDFRKHSGWYLSGYPVGPEMRRRFSMVKSLCEFEDLLGQLDPQACLVDGGERIRRGHTNGPIRPALPEGFRDAPDADSDMSIPDDDRAMAVSGG